MWFSTNSILLASIWSPIGLALALVGPRLNVATEGTTMKPGFTRVSEQRANPCPESHPHPFHNFTECCSESDRDSSGCGGKTGHLLGRDEVGCCPDGKSLDCPHVGKCKAHPTAQAREAQHVLLIGNVGMYDFSLDAKGVRYDNLQPWPHGKQDNLVTMAMAVEYPSKSGQVVLCGGHWEIATDCHRYELKSNQWSGFPSLLEARNFGRPLVVDGTLWFFGGQSAPPIYQVDTTEYYDEANGEWRFGHPLPQRLRSMGVAAVSESAVFIAGGHTWTVDGQELSVDTVYVFDVLTGSYETKTSAPLAVGGVGISTLTLPDGNAGVVITCGITTNVGNRARTAVYDLQQDAWWTERTELNFHQARIFNQQYVTVDGTLWLFGGVLDATTGLNDSYSFDVSSAGSPWVWRGDFPLAQIDDYSFSIAAVQLTVKEYLQEEHP